MLETMVIENNNPNLLPVIVLILAVLYIGFSLVSIKVKKDRKKRLEQTKKIIDKNHERILLDAQVKRGAER